MSTTIIALSPSTIKSLLWLMVMLLTDYAAVVVAILVDLRSGTLRARREGRPRTSRGYRRTVEKASRYLVTLLALSVIDAMIVGAAMLFRSTMHWEVPVFPLFTTVGAVALTLIESRSVVENSQNRADFTSTAAKATSLLTDKEVRALIDAVRRLLDASDKHPGPTD